MELDKIVNKNLKMGRANQEVFAETLENLAAADPSIIAVTSDSRGSGNSFHLDRNIQIRL